MDDEDQEPENGENGEEKLEEVSLVREEGRGLNPVKVKRHCTDCLWHLPFGITSMLCIVITWHSCQVGNINNLFRLPDFTGRMCGGPHRPDKGFLYFCMDMGSEHVFDEKNKTLASAFPICVSSCPQTFNTSSLCYVGGPVESSAAWQWVQNYPSQSLAGCICRPHSEFALSLFRAFEKAVSTAPPNLTILLFLRNWLIFARAGIGAIFFSIIFILLLSKCARTLIWTAFSLVVLVCSVLCLFFASNFQWGSWRSISGHGAGDIDDAFRAVVMACAVIFNVCQMVTLKHSLESAGRVMEKACKCILSTPSLVLMPLFLSIQRSLLLIWWFLVVANYMTSEKLIDVDIGPGYHPRSILKKVKYGFGGEWEYDINVAWSYQIYAAFFTFGLLWCNETFTAGSVFVMFFTGQVYQLVSSITKEHIRCRTMRGYCLLMRYHFGSVIFAGLLQLFLAPLHLTLGFFEEANTTGPVGFLLDSFCSCVLDFYRNYVGRLRRDALQDVCLYSMCFLEAADHIYGKHAALEDVRVLNTQTKIFQIGGLGLAGLLGWMITAHQLQQDPYHDKDQDEYVQDPFRYCLVGCIVAVWVALPFMKIFDVVSDAVIYSIFVQEISKPPPPDLVESVLRSCDWTRAVSTRISSIAHCNCGTQRSLLPVNRPPAMPKRPARPPDFETQPAQARKAGTTAAPAQAAPMQSASSVTSGRSVSVRAHN